MRETDEKVIVSQLAVIEYPLNYKLFLAIYGIAQKISKFRYSNHGLTYQLPNQRALSAEVKRCAFSDYTSVRNCSCSQSNPPIERVRDSPDRMTPQSLASLRFK